MPQAKQINKPQKKLRADLLERKNKPTSPAVNQPGTKTAVPIPLGKVIPSPLEPQARRRKKFETKQGQDSIAELAASIAADGLFQPITVRRISPIVEIYEIVFGERRFLAHRLKNLPTILCFVEDLTDAQVIEKQYKENHQRLEPDALTDAFTFQYLIDHEGYTENGLADRFSTSLKNVRLKLRLNSLVPEAKKELEDGELPLRHAYYLATFPVESQNEIVRERYAYDIEEKALPFSDFKLEVEEHIIRNLAAAPFDPDDPRLHIKELQCRDCSDNSENQKLLFDDLTSERAVCLNKPCFELKTNVNLRVKQAEIAEQNAATMGEAVDISNRNDLSNYDPDRLAESQIKAVPLVTEKQTVNKKTLPVKGDVLTDQEIFDEPECEFSVLSLAVDGVKKGRKVYVCQNGKCPVHNPAKITAGQSDGEPSAYELQLNEKQFQIDVALVVREKVLEKSIEFFNGSNSFWQYADLIEKLIVEFISERAFHLKELSDIFKDFKNFPKNLLDKKSVEAFVHELDPRRKDQLLFLLVFSKEGYMSATGEYKPQAEIEKLAKSYAKLDYHRLDADVRVELAPDEFKEIARDYRNAVFIGDQTAEIPRFWWMEFELPD